MQTVPGGGKGLEEIGWKQQVNSQIVPGGGKGLEEI
jgi:hypothetical protein